MTAQHRKHIPIGVKPGAMSTAEALAAYGEAVLVRSAYLRLSPDKKAALTMQWLQEGDSQSEIARLFGVSLTRVGHLIARAKSKMDEASLARISLLTRDFKKPRAERFWDFVFYEPNCGCWLYAGDDNGHGYGLFNLHGHRVYAHRFAYEQLVGPVPSGLEIDHKCAVRCCVNPEHLEAVTGAENVRRAAARGAYDRPLPDRCIRGHPFDSENTRIAYGKNGRPRRVCLECQRMHNRASRARRRARGDA